MFDRNLNCRLATSNRSMLLAGDEKAWRAMAKYNRQDVRLTEQLYDRLRPWIWNHPHLARLADQRAACNKCHDGGDLERAGTYLAQQIRYQQFRCRRCGGLVRGTRHSRAAVTHGVT